MAKLPRPLPQRNNQEKTRKVEITLGSARDIPVTYANKVVINFTGNEFLLTIVSAFPDPWRTRQELPTKVEGKILGRYAFSIVEWVAASKSICNQIDRLQAEGAFTVKTGSEITDEEVE